MCVLFVFVLFVCVCMCMCECLCVWLFCVCYLYLCYPGNRGGGKPASEEEGRVDCALGGITSQMESVLISSHLDPHRLEREDTQLMIPTTCSETQGHHFQGSCKSWHFLPACRARW